LFVDTEAEVVDIVQAIDVVTSIVGRVAKERNQFASAMIDTDLDAAEATVLETEKQLTAARTLLNFAYDLLGQEPSPPANEYEV
jgi:hypothetical protein